MHTKKRWAVLVFGLVASYGLVNAAAAPLGIIANGDPFIQLGFGDVVNITYTITNRDPTQAHTVHLRRTPLVVAGAIRQLGGNSFCNPSVSIPPLGNCLLGLQIVGTRVPAGGFEGGPEVCIGTTDSSCSQPNSFNWLIVNR